MGPYRTNSPPPKDDPTEAQPRLRLPLKNVVTIFIGTIALLAGLVVSSTGCAWFQKNEPYFPTPADVSCVYAAVESGVQDPAGIIAACPALAALAIEDLIKLISGIVLGRAHRIEAEKVKAAVSVSGPPVHVIVIDGGAK